MKAAAVKSVGWAGLSQAARQVVQIITLAILAKLLTSQEFGLLAMCTVVTRFMDLFKDMGTGAAIIQKKEISDNFLSSVFWVNILLGLVMMLLLIGIAPAISFFYKEARLTSILQYLSLGFLLTSVSITLKAHLEKKLSFKVVGISEVTGVLFGSGTAIWMAYNGGGVWSLVAQTLVTAGITSLLLWTLSAWKPQLVFKWADIKSISNYSLNYMGFTVFNYLSRNADYILIGRFLGAEPLGYYTMAYQIIVYPLQNITGVVSRVLFPVFSKLQDDNPKMRQGYLRIIRAISLITFPLMFGLWILAEPFVEYVLGAHWLPIVPILLILAPLGVTQSIGSTVGSIYLAKGKTNWMFIWGVVSSTIVVIAFVIGIQWGLTGIAWSYLIATLSLHYFNLMIPLKLIELKITAVYKAIGPALLCSMLMLVLVYSGSQIAPQSVLTFAGLVLTGAAAYGLATWYLNRSTLLEVYNLVSRKQ